MSRGWSEFLGGLDQYNQKDKIILANCCTILYNIIVKRKRVRTMKKVVLDLTPVEIEYLISALNDSMENYKDDFEMFETLLDLKLKIRKEQEICIMLD